MKKVLQTPISPLEFLKEHLQLTKDQQVLFKKMFKTRISKIFIALLFDKNVKIVAINENAILARITNFKASSTHGSQRWCISQNQQSWRRYAGKRTNKQYFLWTDHENSYNKLIGFTLVKNTFECCYDNDNQMVTWYTLKQILKKYKIKIDFKF